MNCILNYKISQKKEKGKFKTKIFFLKYKKIIIYKIKKK